MENEIDMREEVLRRYRSTREKKKKCIEDMKELLEKRYIERTGEKPKYFFSLYDECPVNNFNKQQVSIRCE